MSDIETRRGGCHCGKVRYEVKIDLSKPVISCNCSMCGRSGTLLEFQFSKHVIHPLFCRVCGIKSFARGVGKGGVATVAINTRCLDDIDITRLAVTPFDAKSR